MATCILTAVHIFPPANKTDGSWLEKPGLCRKGNLAEGEDFGSILPHPSPRDSFEGVGSLKSLWEEGESKWEV